MHVARQHDSAGLAAQGSGFDDAAIVDRSACVLVRTCQPPGKQRYRPAVGPDVFCVFDQRGRRAAVYPEAEQGLVADIERGLAARTHEHLAGRSGNVACILHPVRQHHDVTAVYCGDRSRI